MERSNRSNPTLSQTYDSPPLRASGSNSVVFTTPQKHNRKSDTSVRFNDDEREKKERVRNALDLKRRRSTMLPSPRKKTARDLELSTEVTLPVLTNLSVEEINRRYEEWMKIAADNKINTTNTWDFELIDYFSKLSFFQDGNSINFQKASCTLDGCVKVYTSRVDSVVSETGILLNGLAESTAERNKALAEEIEEGTTERTRKKSSRTEQTLVKDISSLSFKNFDFEACIDPLFKKTCADFDEGGARGLLLSNLTTEGTGRLTFDVNDTFQETSNTEELEAPKVVRQEINLEFILDHLFNESGIQSKDICPTLSNFQLGSSLPIISNELKGYQNEDDTEEFADPSDEHDDYFVAPPSVNGDDTYAHFKNQVEFDPIDPVDNLEEEDAALYPAESQPEIGVLAQGENMFSYFDDRFIKNWAGPEHWKLKPRKLASKAKAPLAIEPKAKAEKSHFEINFNNLDEDIDIHSLFSTRGPTTENRKMFDHTSELYLLPQDLHFSSKNFLNLFTKPNFSIKPKNDKPADDDFFEASQFEDPDQGMAFDDEVTESRALEPQNSVFGGMDNTESLFDVNTTYMEKDMNNINLGEQLIPALKRIQEVRVNYMRIAKRVDVKLLKENIWKKISSESAPQLAIDDSKGQVKEETCSVPEPQPFSKMVKQLSSSYTPNKFKDISVPFCFICLLHLANEHNLEIESTTDMDELIVKHEDS